MLLNPLQVAESIAAGVPFKTIVDDDDDDDYDDVEDDNQVTVYWLIVYIPNLQLLKSYIQ